MIDVRMNREYLATNHASAMALWRETGRKYWLKRAASYWRQSERLIYFGR